MSQDPDGSWNMRDPVRRLPCAGCGFRTTVLVAGLCWTCHWRSRARELDPAPTADRTATFIVWNPDSPLPPQRVYSGPQAVRVAEAMAARHPGEVFHVCHVVASAGQPRAIWEASAHARLLAAWAPFTAGLVMGLVLHAAAELLASTSATPST